MPFVSVYLPFYITDFFIGDIITDLKHSQFALFFPAQVQTFL